jgi:hypothetical protein
MFLDGYKWDSQEDSEASAETVMTIYTCDGIK